MREGTLARYEQRGDALEPDGEVVEEVEEVAEEVVREVHCAFAALGGGEVEEGFDHAADALGEEEDEEEVDLAEGH